MCRRSLSHLLRNEVDWRFWSLAALWFNISSPDSFAGFWVSGSANRCCLVMVWERGCPPGSVGVDRADQPAAGLCQCIWLQVHKADMVGSNFVYFFLPLLWTHEVTAWRRTHLVRMIPFLVFCLRSMLFLVKNLYFYTTLKSMLRLIWCWQVQQW